MLLALDLSTHSTGWAVYDNKNLIDYGCIGTDLPELVRRISKIINELDEKVLKKYKITKIIVEEVQPTGGYGIGNQKTHKALMYLQGALVMHLYNNYKFTNIEFIYPSSWRAACDIKTGRGIKREELKQKDIEFVKEKFNINVNDDIADAIGIGYSEVKRTSNEINFT